MSIPAPGELLPVSAVIPTIDRAPILRRMLESVLRQEKIPGEIVIIDASSDDRTVTMLTELGLCLPVGVSLRTVRAEIKGAAAQRNQGCALATQPFLLFLDDDVILEPRCLEHVWAGMASDPAIGGVCATIVNCRYVSPGFVSSMLFRFLNGRREPSYAGRVLGPAVNIATEDRPGLPDVVAVDWMHLGCTLYRRELLPEPPFDSILVGYSMLEDVTLSIKVGRKGRLVHVRAARLFHDSQPGAHKADVAALSCMEFVNRHYVMTQVLGRKGYADYLRLFVWELFQVASCAINPSTRSQAARMARGKMRALGDLLRQQRDAGSGARGS